jgi:hypothetical protein
MTMFISSSIFFYLTPQVKGRWESNINVWFPFTYSQKWNCALCSLVNCKNRILMFCFPIPTLIYLCEIYIFPGSVCLFCCSQICGTILGIYKSLTQTRECSNWDWCHAIPFLGIHKFDFRYSAWSQDSMLMRRQCFGSIFIETASYSRVYGSGSRSRFLEKRYNWKENSYLIEVAVHLFSDLHQGLPSSGGSLQPSR